MSRGSSLRSSTRSASVSPHHHYQSSANQGFRWWEIDFSYYLILLLAVVGLVWGVRKPPRDKRLPAGSLLELGNRWE